MLFLLSLFFSPNVLHIIAFLFSVNLYIAILFLPAVSSTVLVHLPSQPILSSSVLSPKLNFQSYGRNMFSSIFISSLNSARACVRCILELCIVSGVAGFILPRSYEKCTGISFLNDLCFLCFSHHSTPQILPLFSTRDASAKPQVYYTDTNCLPWFVTGGENISFQLIPLHPDDMHYLILKD